MPLFFSETRWNHENPYRRGMSLPPLSRDGKPALPVLSCRMACANSRTGRRTQGRPACLARSMAVAFDPAPPQLVPLALAQLQDQHWRADQKQNRDDRNDEGVAGRFIHDAGACRDARRRRKQPSSRIMTDHSSVSLIFRSVRRDARVRRSVANWQECTDSNRGPSVLETDALPTELHSCSRGRPLALSGRNRKRLV